MWGEECVKYPYCAKHQIIPLYTLNLHNESETESASCSAVSYSLWPHGTIARQAPLFLRFSRQEYWNVLPFPSPGDLPSSGIKPGSPALQADSLPSEPPGKPWTWHNITCQLYANKIGGRGISWLISPKNDDYRYLEIFLVS